MKPGSIRSSVFFPLIKTVLSIQDLSDFTSMVESVCQFLPRKDWEEVTGTRSLWNSSIVFSFALFFAEDSEVVCIFVSFFIRSLLFLGGFKFFLICQWILNNFTINFIDVAYFIFLVCGIHWTPSIWMYVCKMSSVVYNSFRPLTRAHQASLFTEFSRQEYWSGLPFPLPGDPPNPGNESMSLMSPALAGSFFTTSITWEAHLNVQWSPKLAVIQPCIQMAFLFSI